VFVGFMGVVLAIGPIAGQLFGAKRLHEAGAQLHQTMWLALGMSAIGSVVLWYPEPFLALSQSTPEVAARVRSYLHGLAFALPCALLFTAFRGFNVAVSRPKIVMTLQFGALLLKIPLNAMLVFGTQMPTPWGTLRLAAHGAAGCGAATAIVVTAQWIGAWLVLRHDPLYASFGMRVEYLPRPDLKSLVALLRLGVPMGASIAIEVTGFTFMAFFIARLGAMPVAGHQIAVNMVSVMYMMPLALGSATSTLVAQAIGAQQWSEARRIGWHGMQLGWVIAAAMGGGVYLGREGLMRLYTDDAAIIAAAMPLLAWVILFHLADATQTIASFTLRAYKVVMAPVAIFTTAVWGVGLGGGYVLAFNLTGWSPHALQSARGFWAASTAGLMLAATLLCLVLAWLLKTRRD